MEWKISVGDVRGRPLHQEDFTTCVSCCGPDGLLGEVEHPRQESLCQFNADFTALVINQTFASDIVKSILKFPMISSSDIDFLSTANGQESLNLVRYENPEPIELVNMQGDLMIGDHSLSKQVNIYKQLCQLEYQAVGVGGGDSGGGVFFHDEERSELILVGVHKSTQTDEQQGRTDLHTGIGIHFILHALSCKFGKLH